MKKLISGLVIGGILGSCMFVYAAATSWTATKASFKVMVRGEEFISENPAIVVEGRTYLPLRAMGDALGVNVEWNDQLRQAEVGMATKTQTTNSGSAKTNTGDADKGKTSWIATKASFKVMVRGEEFISENPPIVVEGRTYLPLRALGDALGVRVEWNESLRQAQVGDVTPSATIVPVVTPSTTPASGATPKRTSAVSAADTITVEMATVEAKAGDVVEIPITFSNISKIGIATIDFTVTYNAANLEFIEAPAGDIVKNAGVNYGSNKSEDGSIKFLFLDYTMTGAESINSNGVFTKLNLKLRILPKWVKIL